MSDERGGIVLRVDDGALAFLPASVAVKVAPLPRITRVAGAPFELLGIALHEGEIMPVISIGNARKEMVVCTQAGELLGLVGGTVLGTGMFEAEGDGVTVKGAPAPLLDVAALYARVQEGAWAGKWGG